MRRRLALVLSVVALPVAASAQALPVPQLRAGQRVRVELAADRPARVEGLLLQVSPELLTVVSGRTRMQAIATTNVHRLHVSEGRRISRTRALVGILVGPVAGAALGAGIGSIGCDKRAYECAGPPIGLVVGTGVGLAGGAAWGLWPRERWREVPLR